MKKARILFTMALFALAISAAIGEGRMVLDAPDRQNVTTMGEGCDTCEAVTGVNCIDHQVNDQPRCKCKLDDAQQTQVDARNLECRALWMDPNGL